MVNIVARDYDALWTAAGGGDELDIWRDTGLYDEEGGSAPLSSCGVTS